MRPAAAHGPIHPRLHPGADWLEPRQLIEAPARLGLSLLVLLDAVGGLVLRRWAAHRAAIPASSRISPATAVVLGGVLALAGMFSWGVLDASSGASQWMTAPGAGNAEASIETSTPGSDDHAAAAAAAAKHASSLPTIHESLVVVDGGMVGHDGWPEFVGSAKIDLPAHAKVDLTIYSFDDGPAPLAKSVRIYDKVMGTVGGTESYEGKAISSVSNKVVSHTFTVPGIGLNIPIPAAKSSKSGEITPAVVTASFVTSKKGTFTWQCYAPCGSGKNGMSGAMKTPGYMTGKVVIG